MAATTESARDLEFLISEAPGTLSREQVVVASGAGVLAAGTVMAKITGSGLYVPYDDDFTTGDPAAADGREVAVGVLTHVVDATSANAKAGLIVRLAEVASTKLVWHSNNDGTDQTNGLADLAAKFIIAR